MPWDETRQNKVSLTLMVIAIVVSISALLLSELCN